MIKENLSPEELEVLRDRYRTCTIRLPDTVENRDKKFILLNCLTIDSLNDIVLKIKNVITDRSYREKLLYFCAGLRNDLVSFKGYFTKPYEFNLTAYENVSV